MGHRATRCDVTYQNGYVQNSRIPIKSFLTTFAQLMDWTTQSRFFLPITVHHVIEQLFLTGPAKITSVQNRCIDAGNAAVTVL